MKQLSVELQDRVLRFDGVSIVEPDHLVEALLRGVPLSKLRLTEHTQDTLLFNDSAAEQLSIDSPEPVKLDFAWQLPTEYMDLDLEAYVVDKAVSFLDAADYTAAEQQQVDERISLELQEIRRRGMVEFMKTIIFILDTFRKQNVVWGVGRGSSCASYVLFILGLHSVDCIRYNVPLEEFFHD